MEPEQHWKWHSIEIIVEKLAVADEITKRGLGIADITKGIGVCEATYRRWKKRYGGLSLNQVRYVRRLELENARMQRVIQEMDHAPHQAMLR